MWAACPQAADVCRLLLLYFRIAVGCTKKVRGYSAASSARSFLVPFSFGAPFSFSSPTGIKLYLLVALQPDAIYLDPRVSLLAAVLSSPIGRGTLSKDLSFPTIAGSDANGAIIHYSAEPGSCRTVGKDSMLLLDSGAQVRWNSSAFLLPRIFHIYWGVTSLIGGRYYFKLGKRFCTTYVLGSCFTVFEQRK